MFRKAPITYCFIVALIAFFVNNEVFGQIPNWGWIYKANQVNGNSVANGIGTDANGNSYITGWSSGQISFSGNSNIEKMFLAKFNAQGTLIWSSQVGNCQPTALVTDQVGNTYVTGRFRDTLDIGGTIFMCHGKIDLFVAKFDSSGQLIWARQAGGAAYSPQTMGFIVEEDEGTSIGIDAAGNCYVSAVVRTRNNIPAYFDSIVINHTTGLVEKHSALAKYNSSGQIQWVRKVGSQSAARALAVTSLGDCYLTGIFEDSISFGNTTFTSNGYYDGWFVRYNSSGNLVWAKSFGGPGGEYADAIAINDAEEVFIAGSFEDSIQIGNYTLIGKPDKATLYLAKSDNNGNIVWASQTTGPGPAMEPEIAVDNFGNCFTSCTFREVVGVGTNVFSSSSSTADALVIKWDASGEPVWSKTALGFGTDSPNGISLHPSETICYIVGSFEYDLKFDDFTIITGENSNIFVAQLKNITTGIFEETNGVIWSVYPNPTTNSLYLKLYSSLNKPYHIRLIDMTGRVVSEQTFTPRQAGVLDTINIEKMPPGIYCIHLTSEGIVATQRIVVQ